MTVEQEAAEIVAKIPGVYASRRAAIQEWLAADPDNRHGVPLTSCRWADYGGRFFDWGFAPTEELPAGMVYSEPGGYGRQASGIVWDDDLRQYAGVLPVERRCYQPYSPGRLVADDVERLLTATVEGVAAAIRRARQPDGYGGLGSWWHAD